MTPQRPLRTGALLFAFSLVATACAAGSEEDEGLTIDGIIAGPSEEDHLRVWGQMEESIQACMAEAGFEYVQHVQPRFSVNSAEARTRSALLTGADREFVEANGYGIIASLVQEEGFFSSDPNLAVRRALGQGEAQAYGEAFSTCAVEARNAAGFDERYLDLSMQVTRLITELEGQILADPRLTDGTAEWAACMNALGHNVRGLADARDEFASQLDGVEMGELDLERLQAEEVALAVDDLGCREDSGVDEVLDEVTDELEAEFVDRHAEVLAEYNATRSGA